MDLVEPTLVNDLTKRRILVQPNQNGSTKVKKLLGDWFNQNDFVEPNDLVEPNLVIG